MKDGNHDGRTCKTYLLSIGRNGHAGIDPPLRQRVRRGYVEGKATTRRGGRNQVWANEQPTIKSVQRDSLLGKGGELKSHTSLLLNQGGRLHT